MEDVMNNPDLRGVIFSFFRTKAYKQCQDCKRVIMWNRKKVILKYVEWHNFISCNDCYKYNFFKTFNNRLMLANLFI